MSIKRTVKRNKMVTIAGLSILALTLAGCGTGGSGTKLASAEDSKVGRDCLEWSKNEDGSQKCEDKRSSFHNQLFFNGLMFTSLAAMSKSADYKANNLKNGTNVNLSKGNTTSKSGKSGFGSGGRGGSSGS